MAIPLVERTRSGTTTPLRVAVMGRQGAGKGTQCTRLSTELGLVHVSTGDLLRQAIADASPLGLRVASIVESGALVPDDVMTEVVLDRLAQPDAIANGFLLDGFPRTIAQASTLLAMHPVDAVVDLSVPVDVVVDRLTRRRVCPACGTVTTVSDPSEAEVECPRGDGVAVRRIDDTDEAIRQRLALYDGQTRPVLDWYAERGLLVTVDAVGSTDKVFRRVCTALVNKLDRPN